MDDLISRQAAINALKRAEALTRAFGYHNVIETIRELPTADLSEYCDKLWKTAYERGKAEAHPNGKWIDGQCSICGCDVPAYIIDWKWQKDMDANFCPNCGARMEE